MGAAWVTTVTRLLVVFVVYSLVGLVLTGLAVLGTNSVDWVFSHPVRISGFGAIVGAVSTTTNWFGSEQS